MSAIILGFTAGMICYIGVLLKEKLGYDDSLDVVGIHGLGGIWGAIGTGLFASTAVNAAGADGLFFGNPVQLGIQLVSIVATCVFAFVLSFVLLKIVDALVGLRISSEEEEQGLDLSQHSETGYQQ
jgi:Amt family ammonium transporter